MSKQAVVKDGDVVIVDTDNGTYTKATADNRDAFQRGVGSFVDVLFGGVVGAAVAPIEAVVDAVSGQKK